MALPLARENYVLHKLHSLTGIVPVGFYMVQHLTLNSFSIAGPAYFNGVIGFFGGMPAHFLFIVELLAIWLPLAFHAMYGFFITMRAEPNYLGSKYKWSQNRMYSFQRYSGLFLFLFLIYHVISTTGAKYVRGEEAIQYAAMQSHFTSLMYFWLVVYALGVLAASYHFAYGIWNFCIRWGITISERSQRSLQRFAFVLFVAITLLGWGALAGFLMHDVAQPGPVEASAGVSSAVRA